MTRYPIYVISKGRADSRHTSKALERMGVAYNIVVEPQEYEEYFDAIYGDRCAAFGKLLRLPYENYGNGCSIPARNWVWEHAKLQNAERHWILDDNILVFMRLNRNEKLRIETGDGIFRAAEDFADRYENIGLAGFNYRSFCKAMQELPPFYLNTRIYSCILVDNSLPFRWRGRYNEDTDLSLRVLKSGLCTVLFNAFLAEKPTTMRVKGGNTDELYADGAESRRVMTESLIAQHPDVARMTEKFGHPHHHVDYSSFKKNKLRLKAGVVLPAGSNEYGMRVSVEGASSAPRECAERSAPRALAPTPTKTESAS